MEKNNIPRIIHYCWFGSSKKNRKVLKMIKSWKKNCPNYKIIEWNEGNFDISMNKYVKQAYENKKYAFVSDVARLYALYEYGGIYLDTDVEIIKQLDQILTNQVIVGFQDDKYINTGLIVSTKKNIFIERMLSSYNNREFVKENGEYDTTTNVKYITNELSKIGLKQNNEMQTVGEIKIYPKEYFCPIDYVTGKRNITENTYAIHWFDSSWLSNGVRYRKKITKILYRLFGKDCLNWMKKHKQNI